MNDIVERLREENAELISAIAKEAIAKDDAQKRLAEAERLLRETRKDVEFHASEAECWDCVTEQGECIRRLERIDAFLAGASDKEEDE